MKQKGNNVEKKERTDKAKLIKWRDMKLDKRITKKL